MKIVGGLMGLREHFIRNCCIVTGKSDVSMTPAVIKLKRVDGSVIEQAGMVASNVKAGRKTKDGGQVISVTRNGIKLDIQKNDSGVVYAAIPPRKASA